MIKQFVMRMLERRHYWRTVGFSQMAELYVSRLFRLMALYLVAGMSGIYMYQLGYAVYEIMLVFLMYFLFRLVFTIPSAYLIARIGPKHAMLASNFLYVPGLLVMTQVETYGWKALFLFALLQGSSIALYNISYYVNFSKIKSSQAVGKELSFMTVAEKIGTGLSPFIGGMIAFLFGPEATMISAGIILFISTGPLLLSPEPVSKNQIIQFRGFNIRRVKRQLLSATGVGADMVSSMGIWTLFIAVTIFGTTHNDVYAKVGGLMTVAFISGIIFSRVYGMIVDKNRGKELLRASVIGNSLVHFLRPFITTPVGVVLLNTVNEGTTSGYVMPYLKGQFDMADSLPGFRIVYMTMIEAFMSLGAVVTTVSLTVLTYYLDPMTGLSLGYVFIGIFTLVIMVNDFPALRRRVLFGR